MGLPAPLTSKRPWSDLGQIPRVGPSNTFVVLKFVSRTTLDFNDNISESNEDNFTSTLVTQNLTFSELSVDQIVEEYVFSWDSGSFYSTEPDTGPRVLGA